MKRNTPPPLPRNLPIDEYQQQKLARDNQVQLLHSQARAIRSATIFNVVAPPENIHEDDQELIQQIFGLLPANIHVNGVPYDITIRPDGYLNSYIG